MLWEIRYEECYLKRKFCASRLSPSASSEEVVGGGIIARAVTRRQHRPRVQCGILTEREMPPLKLQAGLVSRTKLAMTIGGWHSFLYIFVIYANEEFSITFS